MKTGHRQATMQDKKQFPRGAVGMALGIGVGMLLYRFLFG